MYSLPALVCAVIFMALATASLAGVLWIFVYGDNPWPSFIERAAPWCMGSLLALAWGALLFAAFSWGKQQESRDALNVRHVYGAAASTIVLLLLVGLHQFSVGNIGPAEGFAACPERCADKGFAASSQLDGMCHCYASDGHEAWSGSVEPGK